MTKPTDAEILANEIERYERLVHRLEKTVAHQHARITELEAANKALRYWLQKLSPKRN